MRSRQEDAIGDGRVQMGVAVEPRAEAVEEGDGADSWAGGWQRGLLIAAEALQTQQRLDLLQSRLCRMNGRWAIRHGDMKLVVGDDSVRAPELFDLAAKKPDTVKELKALWDQWNTQLAPPRRDGANSNFSPGDGGDSELEQIQPAARPSRS